MTEVKITIPNKNTLVAAMARGLSSSFGGNQSVAGATNHFLARNGFLVFRIPKANRAKELRKAITDYLGAYGASVAP